MDDSLSQPPGSATKHETQKFLDSFRMTAPLRPSVAAVPAAGPWNRAVRRGLQPRATNIRHGSHNDVSPWRLLTQARREPCLPGKVRKLPEAMARGHGGGVSARAIDANNGPLIADRSIA